MSTLEAKIDVDCPAPEAAPRLRRFLRSRGNPDGDVLMLDLEIAVSLAAFGTRLGVRCPVVATIQTRYARGDAAPHFAVQWAPTRGGAFPLFAGTLRTEADDRGSSFTLHLHGRYEPPFGIIGKGFDEILGRQISEATANDLLRKLKEEIERDLRSDPTRRRPIEAFALSAVR